MAVTTWLIDKSAYTRLPDSPDTPKWIDRIERGMVRISTITRLEVGYSLRTAADARTESVSPPLALMPCTICRRTAPGRWPPQSSPTSSGAVTTRPQRRRCTTTCFRSVRNSRGKARCVAVRSRTAWAC